jgi:hypothetical protein
MEVGLAGFDMLLGGPGSWPPPLFVDQSLLYSLNRLTPLFPDQRMLSIELSMPFFVLRTSRILNSLDGGGSPGDELQLITKRAAYRNS